MQTYTKPEWEYYAVSLDIVTNNSTPDGGEGTD